MKAPICKSASARTGFALGYLQQAMPDEEAMRKVARATRVPLELVKLACLRKAAGPLGTMLGMAAIPTVGIPLLQGLGRAGSELSGRVGRWIRGAPAETEGATRIGGFSPKQMSDFNRMLAEQTIRNYQYNNLLQQIRMAHSPYQQPLRAPEGFGSGGL